MDRPRRLGCDPRDRGQPGQQVRGRPGERVDELPAGRRRVDEGPRGAGPVPDRGRRAGRRRHRLRARRRPHRGRPRDDRAGPRLAEPGPADRRRADRAAGVLGERRGGSADHAAVHRGGRLGCARRRGRRHPGPGARRPRGARGEGDRRRRLFGGRHRRLQQHQLHPAAGDPSDRRRAAGADLPQPDLLVPAGAVGDLRRGHGPRDRIRPGPGRGGHQRPDRGDPARAGLRRGDRLRPAAHLALSRGAAPQRGQAQGHAHRPPARRARHPRLGRHQHLRPPGAHPRRGQRHGRPGPGGGDRGRGRAGRDADGPPRAAGHLRPARVLALHPPLRARRRRRARGAGPLPAPGRPDRPPAAPGLDRQRRRAHRDGLRAHDLRHQPHLVEQLPRRRGGRAGAGAARRELPGRLQRTDRRDRPRRRRASPPWSRRCGGPTG